jgi:hypothetical protein
MELNQALRGRTLLLRMFITIFCAFWLWIVLVPNVQIDTQGSVGNVSLILEYLYVVAEPLLGIAIISIACIAPSSDRRRSAM